MKHGFVIALTFFSGVGFGATPKDSQCLDKMFAFNNEIFTGGLFSDTQKFGSYGTVQSGKDSDGKPNAYFVSNETVSLTIRSSDTFCTSSHDNNTHIKIASWLKEAANRLSDEMKKSKERRDQIMNYSRDVIKICEKTSSSIVKAAVDDYKKGLSSASVSLTYKEHQ